MGGAQPLAATMAGVSMLAVECDETRIDMRVRTRYLYAQANSLDEALRVIASAHEKRQAMKDGSDAVSDWPLLNTLLNTAGGATWVSLHHRGRGGDGFFAALRRGDCL